MRKLLLALFALAFVVPAHAQNYNATPGSGLVFGSKLIGGVNYPQWVVCDPTTPANCASVNGSGQLSIGVASGAVASGAYSAGSIAAGALVAGAMVDGADATEGTKADTAYSGSGSASAISLLKGIYASVNGSIPAGTAIIGKVGIDQTTPGTTNGVQVIAALPAGTNLLGKTGIDQTTPGTTNGVAIVGVNGATALAGAGAVGTGSPRVAVGQDATTVAGSAPVKGGVGVVNGGSIWNTVAASQTAQVLSSTQAGGTGAVGDYLSHCVIHPTSTSPGVVTVFDGTNTATNDVIVFPGGASSLSNLVPFAIPVGANSVNSGGWKVTTGLGVEVTCYGKFT